MPITLEQIMRESPLPEKETLEQLDIIGCSTVSIQNIYKGMEEGNTDFSIETAGVFLNMIIQAKQKINQPTAFDEECLRSLLEMNPPKTQPSC